MVRPSQEVSRAPDEPDNRFLECALEARADYLVTGNKKHFPFSEFEGTKIVSPAIDLRICNGTRPRLLSPLTFVLSPNGGEGRVRGQSSGWLSIRFAKFNKFAQFVTEQEAP